MEKVLNISNYSIFLILKKIDFFFTKVNPILLLFELPFIKKYHKKKGWNPYVERDKLWNDKIFGFNVITAGGISVGVSAIILISSFTLISKALNFHGFIEPIFYYIPCLGISLLIDYIYVFKNDKYLDYFEKFKKWSVKEKRRNMVFSFLGIIFTIVYFFLSLMCC